MTANSRFALVSLFLVGATHVPAQPYRCDRSVNGIGGGEMSSSAYKCGSTAGRTAKRVSWRHFALTWLRSWRWRTCVCRPGDAVLT